MHNVMMGNVALKKFLLVSNIIATLSKQAFKQSKRCRYLNYDRVIKRHAVFMFL